MIEVKDRFIKLFGPGGDSIPTRQFPDFILRPPRSQSSTPRVGLLSHTAFHKDHAHPKNSRLESNQVWLKLHLVQFCGYGYSNRFILCAEVYIFTHMIRLFSPDQGSRERNEAHILH